MSNLHRMSLGFLATSLMMVLVACSMPSPLGRHSGGGPSDVGDVRITALSSIDELAGLHPTATLEHDGLSRTVSLVPTEGGFIGEAAALPIGDWLFTLELRDASGDLTHSAVQTIRVYRGIESLVELNVMPINATLELVANFGDFPERERVRKVRVSFADGGTMTLNAVEDEAFVYHGEKQVSAGDYEYSIGVYGETFYVSDRLYESPWESVRLESGKTTQVEWNTALGSTSLHAEIVQLPPTPENLQCERSSEGVLLTWENARIANVAGFYIYTRNDEYQHFKEAEYVEGATDTWLLEPQDEETWILLTSVDASGRESFRSEPIAITSCR